MDGSASFLRKSAFFAALLLFFLTLGHYGISILKRAHDESASVSAVDEITPAPGSLSGPVDINTAGADELQSVKGIGSVKAAAIIKFRTQNGPFTDIAQIKKVKGIGPATFEKIREQITIGEIDEDK